MRFSPRNERKQTAWSLASGGKRARVLLAVAAVAMQGGASASIIAHRHAMPAIDDGFTVPFVVLREGGH